MQIIATYHINLPLHYVESMSTLIRPPPPRPGKSPIEDALELTPLADFGPVSTTFAFTRGL